MNGKATLALGLLAGIAGLWLWKGDAWAPHIGIKPAHPEPPKSAAAGTLDAMTPAAIARVEVQLPSGDPFVIERAPTDAGWKLPGNWPREARDRGTRQTLGTLRTRFHAIPSQGLPRRTASPRARSRSS